MPSGREAAVESYVPGRVRIRLFKEHRNQSAAAEIQANVEAVRGVRNVFVNPGTGSVLVEYDPDVLNIEKLKRESRLEEIISDLGDAAQAASEEPWPGQSATAANIVRSFRQFDQNLNRITRGVVDGKTLAPLMLFGLSIGRYLVSERRVAMPWYSLLWYSYSMFMHWHNPTKGGSPQE